MSKIRLHGTSSGYTEIAPVAASGNNTLTLPNDGTIISKDSNGVIGVTSITVGTGVTIGDGKITCDGSALTSINAAQLVGVCTSGLTKTGGFGAMLQLKSTTKTDTTSTDSNSYVDISGMSVTLTPSAGTKCYVTYHIVVGGATGYSYGIRLQRDSTPIGAGDQYNAQNFYASRGGFLTINAAYLHGGNLDYGYLDTHGADGSTAVTYKLRWISPYSQYIYLNRSHTGSSNSTNEPNYLASTITVMEVAA